MVEKVKKEAVKKNTTKKKVAKNKSNTGTSVTKNKPKSTGTSVTKNRPKSTDTSVTKNRPKSTDTSVTKKKPSTLKKIAKVAGRTLKSPVGKAGLLGTAAAAAYYGYKEFAGKKKKPIVKKKVVAKKKVAAKKRKLSPGESKIRKSDIMGGSKGRLSGPSGPLGSKIDKRKKSTVVKNRNTRFDPKKANRAGQRKGQR